MNDFTAIDNPIWSALTSAHESLSIAHGDARRYRPEISPLSGLREYNQRGFDDLAAITPVGERIGLVCATKFTVPDEWQVLISRYIDQMTTSGLTETSTLPLTRLGDGDIPEMLELTKLTEPGPFRQRTIDMGRYYGIRGGIREGGRLAAMAGERMALRDWQEVSAVCTNPDFRGRGYAKALVASITEQILREGKRAFLHVKTENASAKGLYEKLGYSVRCPMYFTVIAHKA